MIALDTNVLVRFLTQDDADQSLAASKVFAQFTSQTPGYVCREVLVEMVWVLERAYGLDRIQVATALEGLLAATEIEIETADDVASALYRYRDDGFDFADLMIRAASIRGGAHVLVTFDRKAAKLLGVQLIGS
jgi:predicted nucleic-acid-binding protein